jgi:MFS family permease
VPPPLTPLLAGVLVFLSMLSSTLLIPAIRPFFAAVHPETEGGLFMFMTVNMLGAIVGAPLLTALADATDKRALVLVAAAVVDGALLFLCSLPLAMPVVLVLRTIQGAANVAAVSLLMGLTTRRGVPVTGGATIAAIAAGAPLGTLLLKSGPAIPLQVGAMLPLVVAVAVAALQPGAEVGDGVKHRFRDVVGAVPAGIFIFAERLSIGLFIVPFSLLCHDVRGFDDVLVGRLFAAFLVPFAVVTALGSRFRVAVGPAIGAGAALYAVSLFASARVDEPLLLALILVVGGVGAAGVYAPALRSVVQLVPADRVGAAMGVVNAMGALGMMLGSGGGGAITRAGMDAGLDRATALTRPFNIAAVCLVVIVAAGLPLLVRALKRAPVDQPADVPPDGGSTST